MGTSATSASTWRPRSRMRPRDHVALPPDAQRACDRQMRDATFLLRRFFYLSERVVVICVACAPVVRCAGPIEAVISVRAGCGGRLFRGVSAQTRQWDVWCCDYRKLHL